MSTVAPEHDEFTRWEQEADGDISAPSGVYPKAAPEVDELGRLLDSVRRRFGSPTDTGSDLFEPRHERRLRRLREEQNELLAWGERLFEQGRRLHSHVFRAQLDRFVSAVVAHEESQVELLQDALLTDIGIVD